MKLKDVVNLVKNISADPDMGKKLNNAILGNRQDEVQSLLGNYGVAEGDVGLIMENSDIFTTLKWDKEALLSFTAY